MSASSLAAQSSRRDHLTVFSAVPPVYQSTGNVTFQAPATAIAGVAPLVHETAHGMGLSRPRELACLLYECRSQLFSILFVAFGRSIGEVGAVMLVGGNVQYKTRVMTTAIMLETNMGHFEYAVALGVALLVVSFVINSIALTLQERTSAPEAQGAWGRSRRGRLGGDGS